MNHSILQSGNLESLISICLTTACELTRDPGDLSDTTGGGGDNGARVVKLLACGARGPGFKSRSRHLNFQRLVISCFQVEIWLKDR